MADDPLLTDRSGLPRRRKLLRVILDSYLRIPLASRVLQTAEHDVLVLCSNAEEQTKQALEAKGIRVQQISATADGRPDFAAIVRSLGELEITSLLIEGGALSERRGPGVGRGRQGVSLLRPEDFWRGRGSLPRRRRVCTGEPQCVQRFELHRFGEDFALEGYFRDPYAWHAYDIVQSE